ncbi:MAG: TIM44-like domain-containing protein [Bacteroidales bacterium]|jgi:hypothetical protein|nr:TIM44-like domain-containing protein [Bacteroidales bacterium]
MIKRILKYLAALLVVLLLSASFNEASSRPGGGHAGRHFSGGGSRSHGSSYGGGGGFFIFSSDGSMIPFLIIVFGYIAFKVFFSNKDGEENEIVPLRDNTNLGLVGVSHEELYNGVVQFDPNFSVVLFKDYVTLLFMRYMTLRGTGSNFNEIKPFFTESTLTSEDINDPATYTEISLRNIEILSVDYNDTSSFIMVEINAEFTRNDGGSHVRQSCKLNWRLTRARGARTIEPEDSTRICCPHCGANENFTDAGTCKHCGMPIRPGRDCWQVVSCHGTSEVLDFRNTYLVYSDTDSETLIPPTNKAEDLDEMTLAIAKKHGVSLLSFKNTFINETVKPIITGVYDAWSKNNLEICRHLITDRQFESMKSWTDFLERNGVHNKLEDILIRKVEFSEVIMDKFYDSVTCRVTISCRDYMVNEQGNVVGGSKDVTTFSEYFTFIKSGEVLTNKVQIMKCPSCGAPADHMGQNGVCEYCNTKITTGKFSWVLSGIEQVC